MMLTLCTKLVHKTRTTMTVHLYKDKVLALGLENFVAIDRGTKLFYSISNRRQ